MRISINEIRRPTCDLRFGLNVQHVFKGEPLLKMQPGGKSLQSTDFRLNRAIACDQSAKRSVPDHSTSKKTPKPSITPNTLIVLCAIVALIVTLAFLEWHIRTIDYAHPVGVEIWGP